MSDDFVRINVDQALGEPPRFLYTAVKGLRQARDDLQKARDWAVHSVSLSDYSVFETRFGLPVGSGAGIYTLIDGASQAMDGTTSGYINDLIGRVAS